MIIAVLIAFLGTVSFAVLFNVPQKQYIYCGIAGALGWLFYLIFIQFSGAILATFIASLVLTIFARYFAFLRKTPVTVFLICGIFPLVPGAGIYYTAYNLIMGNDLLALTEGMQTIKLAGAIAIGLAIILSLPQKLFSYSFLKIKSKGGKVEI